jgi:hypothetical protein
MENNEKSEISILTSQCYKLGLEVLKASCTLRKEISARKKEMNLKEDKDVFLDAEPYVRENLEVWENKLQPIEENIHRISSIITGLKKDHNFNSWNSFSFWNEKMKNARGYDREIHFFPNRVIRFVDWVRHTINSGYADLEKSE